MVVFSSGYKLKSFRSHSLLVYLTPVEHELYTKKYTTLFPYEIGTIITHLT